MKPIRSLPLLLLIPVVAFAVDVCEVKSPTAAFTVPYVAKAPELNTDPNFAEARNNLGLALLQSGDNSGAKSEFLEAVHLKPSYAEAHYNLGLALHQEGKEDQARAEFEKAYEISPELRNAPRP